MLVVVDEPVLGHMAEHQYAIKPGGPYSRSGIRFFAPGE
jgi:hypothetical protein